MFTFRITRPQVYNILQFAGFLTLFLIALQKWMHIVYRGQWILALFGGIIGSGWMLLKRKPEDSLDQPLLLSEEGLRLTYWIMCILTFFYTCCYLTLIAVVFFPVLPFLFTSGWIIFCSTGMFLAQKGRIKEKIGLHT